MNLAWLAPARPKHPFPCADRADGAPPTAPSGGSYCMGRALLLTTKGAPVLSSMLARAVTWAAWVRSGRVQEM